MAIDEYAEWQRVRARIHHRGSDRPTMIAAQYPGLYAIDLSAIPTAGALPETTTAILWLEFTPSDGARRVWSSVALPDPEAYYGGYKTPRVLSWGTVLRSLSEARSGEFEGTNITVELSDTDRLLRGLLTDEGTRYFPNRPFMVRIIDDAARRAGEIPITVMRGLLSTYKPQPQLKFSMTAEDVLSRQFAQAQSGLKIPRRVVLVADFPRADSLVQTFDVGGGTAQPVGAVGKAAPIIYGTLSDQAFETVFQSELPGTDPDGTFLEPNADMTNSGTGTLNGPVGAYVLPFRNSTGLLGRIRTLQCMTTGYNRQVTVRWDAVPGADSYYVFLFDHGDWQPKRSKREGQTFARLIIHNTTQQNPGTDLPFAQVFASKTDGVDVLSGGTGSASHLTDEGRGVMTPIYVGDTTINGVLYRTALIAGHAIKGIISGYFNDKLVDLTTDTDWLTPNNPAAWAAAGFATPYTDINGHRYSLIHLKGTAGDTFAGIIKPIDGSPGIALNLEGIESEGDGTGDLLADLPSQYLHAMVNWVMQSYERGPWLPLPHFQDDDHLPQFDVPSFTLATNIARARLAGGYVGAGIIGVHGSQWEVRQVVQEFNQACDVNSGFNRFGQFFVSMIDDEIAVDTPPLLTDVQDVLKDSFDITDDLQNHFNTMDYSFARDYTGRSDRMTRFRTLTDDDSIYRYGVALVAPSMLFELVRAEETAHDVMGRRLLRAKDPPRRARFKMGLKAVNFELGDVIALTHYGGIGPEGWTAQPLRIIRHEFDLNALAITLDCVDLTTVLATGFILGDEVTIAPTWLTTTTDDKKYGYLGMEGPNVFTDTPPTPIKRIR